MKTFKLLNRQAFTLIELLTVITIALVIVGLTVKNVGNSLSKTHTLTAKTMVSKLEMAVKNYYDAFGYYPPDLTYRYLGQKLMTPEGGELNPILQFEAEHCRRENPIDITSSYYIDPWDNPYVLFFVDLCDEKYYLTFFGFPSAVVKPTTFPTVYSQNGIEWEITQYQTLIGYNEGSGSMTPNSSFLERTNQIGLVVDPASVNYVWYDNAGTMEGMVCDNYFPWDTIGVPNYAGHKPQKDRLTHGFLIWSMGPDIITGTEDDIGNWGNLRSKMI